MPRRIEQVNSFIQEELNKLFLEELEFPKNSLVTITKVVTSKDLGWAKIYLSILPINQQESVLKEIKKQGGHFRHLLSQKFQGYHVPKLEFIFDDSLLKQRLVEREIELLHKENKGGLVDKNKKMN